MRISDWSSECALPICEIHGLDHRREVEPPGIEPRDDRVEPTAALVPAKAAQILAAVEQYVVKPHEGGTRGEHPGRHLLAPEPLLARVEARRARPLSKPAAPRPALDEQFPAQRAGQPETRGDRTNGVSGKCPYV